MVLVPEFFTDNLRQLALPTNCLIVHSELLDAIHFLEDRSLFQASDLGPFRVLRPIRDEKKERDVKIVDSPELFQHNLYSPTPTVIQARLDEVQESPHRWFGDLATPSIGGAVALMTLSAFRHHRFRQGDGEVWLRNPAALGLRFGEGEESLPTLVRNGELEIRGLSVSVRDKRDLLAMWREWDRELSEESLLKELILLEESVSSSYATLLTLRAPGDDPQVRITTGLVIEQVQPFVAQNLVITNPRKVVVNPGEVVPIALPAWCMNQDLPSPSGQEVRQTPFVLDLAGATDQGEVWSLLGSRLLASQP